MDTTSSLTMNEEEDSYDLSMPNTIFFPDLTATGTIALGSIPLTLTSTCSPVETTYEIVHATGGLTGTFGQTTAAGQVAIANGGIIAGQQAGTCSGSTSKYFQINYTADTVTATVVAAPMIAVTTSHSPTVSGQSVTYTASTTPAAVGGTVAFTDSGTTISGVRRCQPRQCQRPAKRPVQPAMPARVRMRSPRRTAASSHLPTYWSVANDCRGCRSPADSDHHLPVGRRHSARCHTGDRHRRRWARCPCGPLLLQERGHRSRWSVPRHLCQLRRRSDEHHMVSHAPVKQPHWTV